MKRRMSMELRRWKDKADRKPLILKGVRRSGKTWLLRKFGTEYYEDTAYFNFEGNAALHELFEAERDIGDILTKLGALREKAIDPDKTLIVFDEIQFCDRALASLKDFSEIVPHYHVVCAASLLGTGHKQLPFPSGTVDFLTLRPLSFYEFLSVCGGHDVIEYVRKLGPVEKAQKAFAVKLERLLKTYLITGGMPEAVDVWIKTGDFDLLDEAQQRILNTFELDFAKYAPNKEFSKLCAVWNSISVQLAGENSKFMFGHAKKGMRAKDLVGALDWLQNAGLVQKVLRVEEPTLPITAYIDYNNFKLYMVDTGLLRKMTGLPASVILEEKAGSARSMNEDHAGFMKAVIGNYVLSELLYIFGEAPYFWRSGNEAEVDFLIQYGIDLIPIEVKSGKSKRTRSLGEYQNKYAPTCAIKATMRNEDGGRARNVPLYMIWKLNSILSV